MSWYQDIPCVCVQGQDKKSLSPERPRDETARGRRVCSFTHGLTTAKEYQHHYTTTTVWYQHNTLHYMEWLLDTITVCNQPGGGPIAV